MDRLLIAAAIVAVAAAIALAVRQRRRPDAPTQVARAVPTQLDRADFEHPGAAWLIVVFTSATCDSCRDVVGAAQSLSSADVAVVEVDYQSQRPVHERYRIEAVPTLVLADRQGEVRASFLGPVSATELQAAVTSVRQ